MFKSIHLMPCEIWFKEASGVFALHLHHILSRGKRENRTSHLAPLDGRQLPLNLINSWSNSTERRNSTLQHLKGNARNLTDGINKWKKKRKRHFSLKTVLSSKNNIDEFAVLGMNTIIFLPSLFQLVTTLSTKSPEFLLPTLVTPWLLAPLTEMHNNFCLENWLSRNENLWEK